jgi:hypothetical protein
MEALRSYYTDVLSGTHSYSLAQKKAILFRRHHAASLFLFSLSPPQIKTVLLAPLLYSFPDEMGTDTAVRQAARNLIFSVLTGDENTQEKMVEFLNLFEHFAQQDEKDLRHGLFTNRYELSRIESPETNVLFDKIKNWILTLGWESDYLEFEQERIVESTDRMLSTMDRAFWDLFRETLNSGDLSLLQSTVKEMNALVVEVHHPSLSERGRPYVDELFSVSPESWKDMPWTAVCAWFGSILHYLRECDAVATEPVYESAIHHLTTWDGERVDGVVLGFQTVYDLLLPLRAKIQVILHQKNEI